MTWNLPPGVTGFEYQISGADVETMRELACSCGFDGTAYAEITHGVVTAWCPVCGEAYEWDIAEEYDD